MPTPPSEGRLVQFNRLHLAIGIVSLGMALTYPALSASPSKRPDENKSVKLEGIATWYVVPRHSRTKHRAGKDELTAAHNRLPLGTKVRVTHLANQKSVVVRIIDRGTFNRHAMIDLCKEAAEKLGMLSEGSARVRLEILPDDKSYSKTNAGPW
jgi:rare lipoprotein A